MSYDTSHTTNSIEQPDDHRSARTAESVESRRVHPVFSAVARFFEAPVAVLFAAGSGGSPAADGGGGEIVRRDSGRTSTQSDAQAGVSSVSGPVCEFCGGEIVDEEERCAAVDDRRCRP